MSSEPNWPLETVGVPGFLWSAYAPPIFFDLTVLRPSFLSRKTLRTDVKEFQKLPTQFCLTQF